MKTPKIRPQLAAPVKRETVATVSRDRDGNAIAPAAGGGFWGVLVDPFAGDDAE